MAARSSEESATLGVRNRSSLEAGDHNAPVSVITAAGLTVVGHVTAQLPGIVYLTVSNPPDRAYKICAVPMVAIVVLLVAQVPPVVASASAVVVPAHNTLLPVMAAGIVLTVIIFELIQPVVSSL